MLREQLVWGALSAGRLCSLHMLMATEIPEKIGDSDD